MKYLIGLFLISFLAGCAAVSDLERVKRGEGERVLFDLSQESLLEIGKKSFESCGLIVRRVNYKPDRIEILGYQSETLGEHGSIYGLFIYSLGPDQSEIYLVRKLKYPTESFARDARQEILDKLDELALKNSEE